MTRFVLLPLLAVAGVVLATPHDARSCDWGRYTVVNTPVYYYPPPAYYHMPAYQPSPTYARPAGPAGPVVEVAAIDMRGFEPKSVTVAPGTTVRWVNRGREPHTVTSRDGQFDSGPMAPGGTFSVTFTRPGTYHYYCRPHEKMGMVGTVVVGSGGAGGSAPGYGGSGY